MQRAPQILLNSYSQLMCLINLTKLRLFYHENKNISLTHVETLPQYYVKFDTVQSRKPEKITDHNPTRMIEHKRNAVFYLNKLII